MASPPLDFSRPFRRGFRRFVKKFLKENLEPLESGDLMSFEEWLADSNYPEWRKEELRIARKKMEDEYSDIARDREGYSNNAKVSLFIKDESYTEYKYPRGIYAREDAFKVKYGPMIKSIERVVFKLKYFIKKVPKAERPAYIKRMFDRLHYLVLATDYTSYETHFNATLKVDCELELYRYMLQNVNVEDDLAKFAEDTSMGNYIVNKYMYLVLGSKRMSGEMDTSLANGFSNLMFILYAVHRYKIDYCGPVVEGDDGLIAVSEKIPDEYFKKMGLNVKMEWHENTSTASFCGMIYDEQELIPITCPLKAIINAPWVARKYVSSSDKILHGLMKAKALSMAWEYPGCPIIYPYAMKVLELLGNVEVKWESYGGYWQQISQKYVEEMVAKFGVPSRKVGLRTRALMEVKFGITIDQQLKIESDIATMTLKKFNSETLMSLLPECWKENYEKYVKPFYDERSLFFPDIELRPAVFKSIWEVKRKNLKKLFRTVLPMNKYLALNAENFEALDEYERIKKWRQYVDFRKAEQENLHRYLVRLRQKAPF